jgi:hypothetical protein
MTRLILIGVDDTDVPDSPGTGRVARGLGAHLEALGLGKACGVTRHQLLVHPAIPYTSHNSALCVGLESEASLERIAEACRSHLRSVFVPGSDPGLCVADASRVPVAVQRFGQEAQQRVLAVDEAVTLAQRSGVCLESVAGRPHGVIGALAAAGLRAGGNDGRFVDLPGVREVGGVLTVGELLRRTAVTAVVDSDGKVLGGSERVDTLDWVRPSLVGGRPVFRVRRDPERPGAWVPGERRNRDGHHED